MAGEWIAMGGDLWTAPEVVKLSAFCQQHVSACQQWVSAKCLAIGALFRIWTIVDTHCSDGVLRGYAADDVDREVGIDGWCDAMVDVGWLALSPEGFVVPDFEKWFSQSSKRRRMNAIYQAESRKRRQQRVSVIADKKLTTEQNRTIQNNKKKTPLPPWPAELDRPEFRAAWADWEKHRREIKKPLTETSIRKQLAQFVQWGIPRSIAAIDFTIRKGWEGLREPDETTNNGKPKTQARLNAALEAMKNADSK